jgi:hypothetical protein
VPYLGYNEPGAPAGGPANTDMSNAEKIRGGRDAYSAIKDFFGTGQAKPLLVPAAAIEQMLRESNDAQLERMHEVTRPFGWYTPTQGNRLGGLLAVAGKIAAELRDANNTTERALYEEVASRLAIPPEGAADDGDDSFLEDVWDEVKGVFVRRIAGIPVVRDNLGRLVYARAQQSTETLGPIMLAAGVVMMVAASRRRPRGR